MYGLSKKGNFKSLHWVFFCSIIKSNLAGRINTCLVVILSYKNDAGLQNFILILFY